MGSGCLKVTKYFLFLFNLLFLILGAVILGFGIWILADKTSFIAVLQMSSPSLKTGAYILIGVGALTMLMGFLGCLGAVNEIRCLLGLYFTCLMIILITQVAAGLVIYFQKEMLKEELSHIVKDLIETYNPLNEDERNLQDAWDYVQIQPVPTAARRVLPRSDVLGLGCVVTDAIVRWLLLFWGHIRDQRYLAVITCCGWTGAKDWEDNKIIINQSMTQYPCSCSNRSEDLEEGRGFCHLDDPVNGTSTSNDWPVHGQGCMDGVEQWLKDNLGVILGVCTGVAVIELLGMILSISLCKNIHSEDYTKVPKS